MVEFALEVRLRENVGVAGIEESTVLEELPYEPIRNEGGWRTPFALMPLISDATDPSDAMLLARETYFEGGTNWRPPSLDFPFGSTTGFGIAGVPGRDFDNNEFGELGALGE